MNETARCFKQKINRAKDNDIAKTLTTTKETVLCKYIINYLNNEELNYLYFPVSAKTLTTPKQTENPKIHNVFQ